MEQWYDCEMLDDLLRIMMWIYGSNDGWNSVCEMWHEQWYEVWEVIYQNNQAVISSRGR